MSSLDIFRQREENVLFKTYSRYPVSVVRGKGARLWEADGKEYVDLLAGIAVTSLGHSNEEIAEVICAQARKLVHVSNLFYQEEQLDYAERLVATCHADKAFFCNSGAEANEAAIKLARRYQRKVMHRDAWEIVSLENCFHGRTLATLAATGKHVDGFEPLPEGFVRVPYSIRNADLREVEAALSARTAAVMVEMIQGEGGVIPMEMEYAKGLAALCKKHGVLLITDEIQAGVARSGKFWSFQHYGIEPDIVTAAKALANGLPLGAMLATKEVAQGFEYGSHATTFGGGALITAVGNKVVEIIERDALAPRADKLGADLRSVLRDISDKLPGVIREVRGLGFLVGIELALSPETAKEVWLKLLERGFILNLTQGVVLRLLPPLIIEEDDLQRFVDALYAVLTEARDKDVKALG